MKWKLQKFVVPAIAMALATVFTGTVHAGAESAKNTVSLAQTGTVTIESIRINGEGDASEAVIRLSAPATYTSFKTTSPLRLVIDLSQASVAEAAKRPLRASGNFKGMAVNSYATEAGVLSRISLDLRNDLEPVIKATEKEIRISFPKPTAPADTTLQAGHKTESSSDKPTTPAKPSFQESTIVEKQKHFLKSITSRKGTILLAIDGGTPEYKVFRLKNPERMVLDLFGVTNDMTARIVPLNTAGIASARLGLYPDKIRVVLDAVNGNFPESKVVSNAEGILLVAAQANDSEQSVLVNERKESQALAAREAADKKAAETRKAKEAELKSAQLKAAEEQKEAAVKAAQKKKAADEKAVEEKTAALHKTSKPLPAAAPSKAAAVPATGATSGKTAPAGPAQVEAIDFQVIDNLSRLSIKVSGNAVVEPLTTTSGFVTLTIKNSTLPKRLQRSLETGKFPSPVLRVTPMVVKSLNRTDTIIKIALRAPAPHQFRHEGDMLYVEFSQPLESAGEKINSDLQESIPAAKETKPATAHTQESELGAELSAPAEQPMAKPAITRTYKGRKVTLEFADAEVRKIFQLLSEVSNKNFVLGDDVTGTISIKLVNVPWDQALDIILDTKGLDKREEGNIVIIRAKGKFKSLADEELEIKKTLYKAIELKTETFNVNYADLAGIVTQFNALKTERGTISPDARTNKIIVKDIPLVIDDMHKLLVQLDIPERQVMIEARIVEATSTFTRNLGVNWGVHYRDGSASFMGINQLDTGFGGLTSAPPTSGTGSSAGGNMGISFGTLTSNIQLDMRLNAAASAGMIKIVSTPKVATLNNKTAKITQGQQIPYTSSTSDKVETKFIEAALSLEVTPHINANGTIGMKIDAKNDSPGTSSGGGAPPINKKQATTEMLLRDGETTVIGGIYVDSDTEGDDGVPFLMDIPFLGKLFKSTNKSKAKSELLVFITPRILGSL